MSDDAFKIGCYCAGLLSLGIVFAVFFWST